jgi:hypothetical protein
MRAARVQRGFCIEEGEAGVMLGQLVQLYRLIMQPLSPSDQDEVN